MASTSRAKKAVNLKVKKPESEVESVTQESNTEGKTFLSSSDLLAIEVSGRDMENSRLLLSIEEQNLANLKLQIENLQYKIKLQESKVLHCDAKYKNEVLKHVNVKKEIWPKYGYSLEDKLGYDVNTGELKKL